MKLLTSVNSDTAINKRAIKQQRKRTLAKKVAVIEDNAANELESEITPFEATKAPGTKKKSEAAHKIITRSQKRRSKKAANISSKRKRIE